MKDLALQAVLLFHGGRLWDESNRCEWNRIAITVLGPPTFDDFHHLRYCAHPDTWECTTKVLCMIVRKALLES